MATAPTLKIYGPPAHTVPLGDPPWRDWFENVVWPLIGQGTGGSKTQGTFPQLQIGKARFTRENEAQELLNVDQGIYVTYSSGAGNIIYGVACNVHRSKGNAFTVGGQLNAYGEAGSTGDVFGLAVTTIGQPGSGTRNLIGFEPDVGSFCNSSTGAKWGMNPVFKDRFDGATAAADGLGSNFYNYASAGLAFSSQSRSTSAEFCGWNVGIEFIDGALDTALARAWSGAVTYRATEVVSSGGVLWKAIQNSTNQLPAAGSAFWVQRTAAGTTNSAVGIDFSSMSITSMARMASAIRLRSSMSLHWEEKGSVGTMFDAVNSVLRLCDNSGTLRLGVDVATAVLSDSQAAIAPGGGAAATLATIGGSGPTTAAQNGWIKVVHNGVTGFSPFWV